MLVNSKGFSSRFINKLIYKFKHTKTTEIEIRSKKEVKFIAVDYIPHLYEKLKYIIMKYEIKSQTRSQIKESCSERIVPIGMYNKSFVYVIPYIESSTFVTLFCYKKYHAFGSDYFNLFESLASRVTLEMF